MRMKPSSPKRLPISYAKARNAALMNQFATPGLGSLIARRWMAGVGQLVLFLCGFTLFIVWFVKLMSQYYGLMFGDVQPQTNFWILKRSLILCVAAWLWSLVTSINLVREAKRNEIAEVMKPLMAKPPKLN